VVIFRFKKSLFLTVLIALIFFVIRGTSEPSKKIETPNNSQNAVVVAVIDGDTIHISGGQQVRYLGIDTPEIGQPFYEEAKDKNRELVLGKTIRLEVCKEKPKDNYGRLLAYVYKEKTLINAELLKKGIARILIIPPCSLDKAEKFRLFQKEAMKNKIGLWGKRERAKDFIYASDATKFIGENKAVYGKVISAHKGKKVVFLNLGNDTTVSLKIVIFKQDLQNFDDFQINPANYYLDKQIVVYGKIKMYKGFPEIIIGSPSQIEVW